MFYPNLKDGNAIQDEYFFDYLRIILALAFLCVLRSQEA